MMGTKNQVPPVRNPTPGAAVSELPDGEATIVVSIQQHLKRDQHQEFRAIVERAFPGRRVFIADGGMRVEGVGRTEQLNRIEAMLTALLDALAEDDDEEEQQFDLDGNPLEGGERDENESLG